MQRYILVRVMQSVIALFVLITVVFFLARASGDPLHLMLGEQATEAQYRMTRQALGLDKPLAIQYAIYISNVVRGDLGTSLKTKYPVGQLILERLPNSAKLAGVSMAFALLLAIPLGMIAAVRKDTGWDTLAKVVAFLGQATPNFWLGIMLIMLFAVWLRWLPTSGMGGPLHYLMPAFTLGTALVAGIARLLRSSMLEVLDTDYVKLARLKGISERRVVWVHALRNALIPVVTFGSIYFALLAGGAVVTETVFNWPGIGRLAYDALRWRDFPLIQGVVLTIAAVIVVVNLMVDVLYAYIDPKIRY